MARATGSPVADAPAAEPHAGGPLEPDEARATFIEALERGEPWYPALLDVVARWVAASEDEGGVTYTYLVAGEAFDWLLLAERLIDAAGSLVPRKEAARLLVHGEAPDGGDELAFARAVGASKHRAHLNFQYGVVVEEALLLSAELELYKARPINGALEEPADVQAYERVYGRTLAELLQLYRADGGPYLEGRVRQSEWQAFTYWCSKYRFKMGEPARVASDTRKALALLSRMQSERGGASSETAGEEVGSVIEGTVC
ncbi:MAG: hypothetical protein AB7L91_14165 [Dehalococcoidia bacterium]